MARRTAMLNHREKQRISVTVQTHLSDFLQVAAGSPFDPHALAAATPVCHGAGFQGLAQRGRIHVSHHQYLARRVILYHSHHQAISVKAHMVQGVLHAVADQLLHNTHTLPDQVKISALIHNPHAGYVSRRAPETALNDATLRCHPRTPATAPCRMCFGSARKRHAVLPKRSCLPRKHLARAASGDGLEKASPAAASSRTFLHQARRDGITLGYKAPPPEHGTVRTVTCHRLPAASAL